mgnify:CR=1 FL=1
MPDNIGYMHTPGGGPWLYDRPWAADNGQFSGRVTLDQWQRYLDQRPREGCLFAVVPDTVADAAATQRQAERWLPVVTNLGFPAAFVAQDGWRPEQTPWDEIACIFIGGSTEWKLSLAGEVAVEGRRRGKHVHMGRVNSFQRLAAAHKIGCDSVDGTLLCFGYDANIPKLTDWLARISEQPLLFTPGE